MLQRLEAWLSEQGLGVGDRLPSERTLADGLCVSRSELRKALAILEFRGALQRRVGQGTFLRESPAARPTLDDLAHRTSPHQAMAARLALEPELAGLAAIHAAPAHLAEARSLTQAMRGAPSWDRYEQLDAAFHQALAEASGNPLLAELYRIINAVRVTVVWPRLDMPAERPPPDYHSFAEHETILDALDRRDRQGAAAAMRTHLKSTRDRLESET